MFDFKNERLISKTCFFDFKNCLFDFINERLISKMSICFLKSVCLISNICLFNLKNERLIYKICMFDFT